MKNLVKGLLTLTVLFIASSSFAQGQKRTPEQKAQNQTTWMKHNLAITDDQSTKVHDIILRHAQANQNMSKDEKSMDAELQSLSADLKPVLTADQLQKFQAHMQQVKQKMLVHNKK